MSKLNAIVVGREELSSGLFFLRVKPDKEIPDFLPGQYIALGLPDPEKETKIVKRAYSIGSAPTNKEFLEFYIATVPDGVLSPRLEMLTEGMRLHSAPRIVGTFTLSSVPPEGNLILVATGTGLAPFMSMLRVPSTWEGSRRITVVHGVRYVADLAYREELEEFSKAYPERFRYLYTISRAGDDWTGDRGYVQQYFVEEKCEVDHLTDHVFLCGNPAMVTEVSEWLFEREFAEHSRKQPGNLHLENYW